MSQNAIAPDVVDWLAAVDDSSRTLRELVAGLTTAQLNAPSHASDLRGSADAVLRLVCGRRRDTDDVTVEGPAALADMQASFPGY